MTNPMQCDATHGTVGGVRRDIGGDYQPIKTDKYGRRIANSTPANDGATRDGGMAVLSRVVQVCGRFYQGKEEDWTSMKERDTFKLDISDMIIEAIDIK